MLNSMTFRIEARGDTQSSAAACDKRDASKMKLSVENKMEPKIFEEIAKHAKHEVIEFDWEPVRKQPRRYGILYPIIGYIVSLVSISLMKIGAFMWLFLIGGFLLFLGGIYCANGIIGEYRKISELSESPKHASEIAHPS